eukprot:1158397-Pelagomonas_calceolata.AAC.7
MAGLSGKGRDKRIRSNTAMSLLRLLKLVSDLHVAKFFNNNPACFICSGSALDPGHPGGHPPSYLGVPGSSAGACAHAMSHGLSSQEGQEGGLSNCVRALPMIAIPGKGFVPYEGMWLMLPVQGINVQGAEPGVQLLKHCLCHPQPFEPATLLPTQGVYLVLPLWTANIAPALLNYITLGTFGLTSNPVSPKSTLQNTRGTQSKQPRD